MSGTKAPALRAAVYALLLLALSACSTTSSASPTQSPTVAATSTSTPLPTPTLTPSPTVAPTPLGGGGPIAFSTDRQGGYDIYLITPDGSTYPAIQGPWNDFFPEYSPSGDKIAFWAVDLTASPPDFSLIVADTETGDLIATLGSVMGSPSWSPDGEDLAVVLISGDRTQIARVAIDQTQLVTLSDHNGDSDPSWSPDGETIAFVSPRDGLPRLYLMDPDGNNQRPLLSEPLPQFEPDWSPDGTYLAFVSGDDKTSHVYIVRSDGTGLRQLTDAPGHNTSPAWSPDGGMLAFASTRTGNREIYLITFDGSETIQITDNSAEDETPSWSPP